MIIIKEYWKKDSFPFLVGLGVSILTVVFPKHAIDILILSFLIIVSIGLFFLSKKSKHKNFLRILGVYIFSNFVVFPCIYLFALKSNSNSFQFDATIFSSEKESSL
jgi:hypothetical protein